MNIIQFNISHYTINYYILYSNSNHDHKKILEGI